MKGFIIMSNTRTFSGLPACSDSRNISAGIAIIGIPHGTLYNPDQPGLSVKAPEAIRQAAGRYSDKLGHYDFDLGGTLLDNMNIPVVDCGDLPGDPLDSAGNQGRTTETIRSMINSETVPIVLGGDDSVPIPFLRAYQQHGPLTVVQVDAHLDWRHEVNGITEGPSSTMRRVSEMPWIDGLIQVGMRGVGSARQEELDAARRYGAEIWTAKEVCKTGVERILDLIPEGAPCVLTIDCDGFDPSFMPAVNAPLPGGLSYWSVIDLIHGLAEKADVLGFDLVEFCPEKDMNGLAALTAARIIINMIGAVIRSKKFSS